eukprot:gene8838-9748_t
MFADYFTVIILGCDLSFALAILGGVSIVYFIYSRHVALLKGSTKIESMEAKIIEDTLAQMKVGCLCGTLCTPAGRPCYNCGKPCTYQPTVNGRPLYRCEWSVLQLGAREEKKRPFIRQLQWYWTCSVCGMEPLYQKELELYKKRS